MSYPCYYYYYPYYSYGQTNKDKYYGQSNVAHHPNTASSSNTESKHHQHPLSKDDIKRQEIAKENKDYVTKYPALIDRNVETIDNQIHSKIDSKIRKPISMRTHIIVTHYSTIETTIYYHDIGYSGICVLNFADALKPGGGYLNGRNAQEECLCRQTLLYPTLKMSSMHSRYKASTSIYNEDLMVYSPNVYVIRDNSCNPIRNPFTINIISAPAVDNRKYVKNASHIMERRIRKIVKLAAYKKNNVLILGAFGCGVFNNNPSNVSRIFAQVLIKEGLKDYFQLVVFPIYKDDAAKRIFEKALA